MSKFKRAFLYVMQTPKRVDSRRRLHNKCVGSLGVIQKKINNCNSPSVTDYVFAHNLAELFYEFSVISRMISQHCIFYGGFSDSRNELIGKSMKTADDNIEFYFREGKFVYIESPTMTKSKLMQDIKESRCNLDWIIQNQRVNDLQANANMFLITSSRIGSVLRREF